MIGIITLTLLGAWLWFSRVIAVGIARSKLSDSASVFAILPIQIIITLIPFIDEIVGRVQFQQLCASEAVVWVSPDIQHVVAAHRGKRGTSSREGYVFPIREQEVVYLDAYTGEPFYKFKAFHTPGGWLMRAGLNLGNSSSCWPDKWTSRENGIDINLLIEKGQQIE